MSSDYEDDYEELEEDQEEEDRPWKVTRATLAEIDSMSPEQLEALIENIDANEEWRDLRETAKQRTAHWLNGVRAAEDAPRCEFLKTNGHRCGSPAMRESTFCYFHGEARIQRQNPAEEANKLVEVPLLEDPLSLQLAITRFCAQLAAGAIDEKRGRIMLAALRLAQKNLGDKRSLYDASL
jgi:hypothetical protein